MNTLIYVGVVIAGAITLLIEAHRNYNSSLTAIPFKEHPILKNVEVSKLCTPREKNIGFVFYSSLYLVTYILVLSSAEIYELITKVAASSSQVGPTDEIQNLFGAQYGKPIFISAAIIALFSIKALKPIESTMRSLAHRLAGVPRGVYRVIEILHGITFEEDAFKKISSQTPFFNLFKENAKKAFADSSYDKSCIPTIEISLKVIDYLAPTLTGTQRSSYFSMTQLEKMSELSENLEKSVEELKAMLIAPLKKGDKYRKDLFNKANLVANDTIALFAVHFLRNNRAVKNIRESEDSAIAQISNEVKRAYRVELNAFALGSMFSMVFSVIAAFTMIYTWNYFADPITVKMVRNSVAETARSQRSIPEGYDRETYATACLKLYAPENEDLEKKLRDILPKNIEPKKREEDDTDADGLTPPSSEDHQTDISEEQGLSSDQKRKCTKIWMDAKYTKRTANIQNILFYSFQEVIGVFLATALAALTAIFGREVRKEDESWPQWKFRRPPFLRLASMAVIPAIVAVVGITIGSFLVYWYNLDFVVTENQIQSFFREQGIFFAMHLGFGFIMGISVLILVDQHDEWSACLTVPLGLVCAIIVIGWYYLTVITGYAPGNIQSKPLDFGINIEFFGLQIASFDFDFVTREAVVYGAYPAFFLFSFAIFLEILEEVPISKRRSGGKASRPSFCRQIWNGIFSKLKSNKAGDG